ncbi:MAG: histidine kinase [Xanthomarina sp.]
MKTIPYQVKLTKRKEFIYHCLLWLVILYFELIRFDIKTPSIFTYIKPDIFVVSWSLVFITTFYFNYVILLPKVFKGLNWKRVLLGILAGLLFFTTLRYSIEEILMAYFFGKSNYVEGTSVVYYIYDNVYYGSLPLLASSIFFIIVFNIRLLEYNKYIIEEKRATEVRFLKAQLNPHFLFNTLNNIYSLVYFKSEKALPAIEKLSELMRYTTYEINKDKIALQDELNYIKSYIELDQLRHKDKGHINFILSIEDSTVLIPPFLLSPLVENALKHGKVAKDSPIVIDLKQSGNVISLNVNNEIGNQKTDKLGGIGLSNLKKSLEINYPKAHSLILNKDQKTFTAQLQINLNGESF